MKIRPVICRFLSLGLSLGTFASLSRAAETNFYYNGNEGQPPSTIWPAIWTNVPGGTATAPTSNGLYITLFNGAQMGATTSPTTVRAPYVSATPSPVVFPGDSLVLGPGTRWILKQDTVASGKVQTNLSGTTGVPACTIANPVFNFPGNNGFAGLTLNGGCLNPGDSGYAYVITGTVQAAPGTQSYVFAGGTPLGTPVLRGINIAGQLSGSGTIVLGSSTNTVPGLQVTGTSNTFTGTWLVQAGWLQGAGDGTQDGYNSLGTNAACAIVVDSGFVYPTGTGSNLFSATGQVFLTNNALLDLGPNLMNSAGTLTLTNNGKMWLHGHCVFSAVTINGTSLPNGYYPYATLANNFPDTFTGLPAVFTTFGGDITVQPPGAAPAYAPQFSVQPVNMTVFNGNPASFVTVATGLQPLSLQWYTVDGSGTIFTPVNDGGQFSGATSNTLTIANANPNNQTNFALVATNSLGSATSSIVSLTVSSPPAAITLNYSTAGAGAVLQPSGADWNSPGYWWDGSADGGLSASALAAILPGVPFVVPPGSLMRTPNGALTAVFPGAELDLNGDGNFFNDTGNINDSTSLLALKQGISATNTGEIYFTNLVINGGRIDNGVTSIAIIDGGMTIGPNNAYFYVDSSGGDRGFQINSVISGAGNIQLNLYSGQGSFNSAYTNDLDITGTDTPFTGTWQVGQGVLLGSGSNSLGTNSINVGGNGALETMYDLNSPNANLTLDGRLFLHQNDTFSTVTAAGIALPQGTFTAAQLNAFSPANFPLSWVQKYGSSSNTASGTLTVLTGNGNPLYIAGQPQNQSGFVGNTANFFVLAGGTPQLHYQWQAGIAFSGGPYTNINDGGQFSGSTTSTLSIRNINSDNALLEYVVIVSNSTGSIMSSPATLTVNPVPSSITLSYIVSGGAGVIEPAGADWNSTGYWWDGTYDNGLPASTLASALPGVPFVILPGGLLRTPANAVASTFPGTELDLIGDGNFIPNAGNIANTTSIMACKQGANSNNVGELFFTNLVINGGQVDNGGSTVAVFDGTMTIGPTNAFFYVDNSATADRGFQINSALSGSGTIQLQLYAAQTIFETAFTNNLNIAHANNPFTGTWLITQGPLLGSAINSLGTNSIDVETNGVLETLYDINDPNASLTLNGMLYLHQHDTFHSVTVNGNALADGTYSAAQLNTLYPTNFPATWTQLNGSSYSSASGSLTVGKSIAAQPLQFQHSGSSLTLSWTSGVLQQATNALGPWVDNASASPPYTVSETNSQMYFRVKQ